MLTRSALLATVALLSLPAVAGAADYYVDGAGGTNAGSCTDSANPCKTIQYAVDAAGLDTAGAPNTVHVKPGTYAESVVVGNGNGYAGMAGGTIDGSWEGAPGQVATIASSSSATVNLGQPNMTLEHVALSQGASGYGVDIEGAGDTVRDAVVTNASDTNVGSGIYITNADATVDHATIENNGYGPGLKVNLGWQGATVRDTTITRGAPNLVSSIVAALVEMPAPVHLERVSVQEAPTSPQAAIHIGPWLGGVPYTATLDDVLATGGSSALDFSDGSVATNLATVRVRQSTFDAYSAGSDSAPNMKQSIWFGLINANSAPHVQVENSILVDAPGTDGSTGNPAPSIACANTMVPSASPPPGTSTYVSCSPGSAGNVGVADPAPVFVGGAPFDWHLAPGSAATDAGSTSPLAADESTTDLDGHPRIASGSRRCDARRDLGAYEVQANGTPPAVSISAPASGVAGQPVAFSAVASGGSSAAATYAWDFGDGTTGSGAAVAHTYAAPGARTVTVTVSDGHGCSTVARRTVTIAAGSGPGGNGAHAPRLTRASVHGRTLRFTLDAAASVKLTGTVKIHGKRKRLRALTIAGKAGANAVKLSKKRFKRGRYSLTLVATAGGKRSAAVKLVFTVRR